MGFGAGIAHGPLLTLLLVSTMRSGFRSGLSAAAALLTIDAWADGATHAAAFLAGFHALLIGTEVPPAGLIALGCDRLPCLAASSWAPRSCS